MNQQLTTNIPDKSAPVDYDVHPLIRERYSPRVFDPQRTIPQDDLLSIFEAARWAASSRNAQPWRFMLATRDDEDQFARVLGGIKENNQRWAQHAAALAIVLTRPTLEHDGRPNTHAWHDVGLAVGNLTVEATSRDVYLRQMGGIYRDALRDEFDIPEEFDIVSVIALGYRGALDDAEEGLAQREGGPRYRRPLSELLFTTNWETPYQP